MRLLLAIGFEWRLGYVGNRAGKNERLIEKAHSKARREKKQQVRLDHSLTVSDDFIPRGSCGFYIKILILFFFLLFAIIDLRCFFFLSSVINIVLTYLYK